MKPENPFRNQRRVNPGIRTQVVDYSGLTARPGNKPVVCWGSLVRVQRETERKLAGAAR